MANTLSDKQEKILFPGDDDILCGKSKACVNHPGSRRYREYIETYRERYAEASTKYQKMMITREIYENLSGRCRFLRFNKSQGGWEEIGPALARDKIGHALRWQATCAKHGDTIPSPGESAPTPSFDTNSSDANRRIPRHALSHPSAASAQHVQVTALSSRPSNQQDPSSQIVGYPPGATTDSSEPRGGSSQFPFQSSVQSNDYFGNKAAEGASNSASTLNESLAMDFDQKINSSGDNGAFDSGKSTGWPPQPQSIATLRPPKELGPCQSTPGSSQTQDSLMSNLKSQLPASWVVDPHKKARMSSIEHLSPETPPQDGRKVEAGDDSRKTAGAPPTASPLIPRSRRGHSPIRRSPERAAGNREIPSSGSDLFGDMVAIMQEPMIELEHQIGETDSFDSSPGWANSARYKRYRN